MSKTSAPLVRCVLTHRNGQRPIPGCRRRYRTVTWASALVLNITHDPQLPQKCLPTDWPESPPLKNDLNPPSIVKSPLGMVRMYAALR